MSATEGMTSNRAVRRATELILDGGQALGGEPEVRG